MLAVDFESYNPSKNALAGGPWLYWNDPASQHVCACFAFDDGRVIDWTPGQGLPDEVARRVRTEPVVAHNVEFDARAWRKLGWPEPKQWIDSMHMSRAILGVGALKEASQILLDASEVKLEMPRILPWNMLSGLARENLLQYCRVDTVAALKVAKALRPFLSDWEMEASTLDLKINDRGVPIDTALAEAMLDIYKEHGDQLIEMAGVDVTLLRSTQQLKTWLAERGFGVSDVRRQTLEDLLEDLRLTDDEDPRDPEEVIRVIEARLGLSVIGANKCEAALRLTGPDGVVRDHLNHRVASTGRAGGRGMQLHNMPHADIPQDQGTALREAAMQRDFEAVVKAAKGEPEGWKELPIEKALSSILRQMVYAPKGYRLVARDLSAIEARMLAWDAGQTDMVEDFRSGADMYAKFGETHLFPGKKLKKGMIERDRICKPTVLGAGYGLGKDRYAAYNKANKVDLAEVNTDEETVIKAYRNGYPMIPALWKRLNAHAKACVLSGEPRGVFRMLEGPGKWRGLGMVLPSGRMIRYRNARVERVITKWGSQIDAVVYERRGAVIQMYGGKWTENRIQAMSWDMLEHCLLTLDADDDSDIRLHVHDEIVELNPVEVVPHRKERQAVVMGTTPDWAPEFPLASSGGEMERYA